MAATLLRLPSECRTRARGEGYKSLDESAKVLFEAARAAKGPEAKGVTLAFA